MESAIGWLIGIAKRLVIDNYRRTVRATSDLPTELPRESTPEQTAIHEEQQKLLLPAIGTGIAAKSAPIEQVQIGNLPGEYYTGILFQDEQGNVTWQPNEPMATLRWEDGGSTYTLFYYSTRYPLGKEDLLRLAESMTIEPVAK